MTRPEPTTIDEISSALLRLGGEADVGDIKDRVEANRGGRPPQYKNDWTYRCTIQALINSHCPQSKCFRGDARFIRVSPARYRLA